MLEVKHLTKKYPSFLLNDVSFKLDKGYIMGFIGMNGAGKTTTLKSILNLVIPDSGDINIFGMDMKQHEIEIKQQLGFMLGEIKYYPKNKVYQVADVFKRFFDNWNEKHYREYLKRFAIDENKRICELSTGMRVKLAITFALSHEAKLLIFDEPTSGLDPIARDELLDLFREIIEDGEKSIIFSTHITSDLDKCADYILFIKNGEIIANSTKDDIIASHMLVNGKKSQLDSIKDKLIGYKENSFGFTGLMKKQNIPSELISSAPDLEDIMIYYNKMNAKE